jgi:AcrR family transcriptional regulator
VPIASSLSTVSVEEGVRRRGRPRNAQLGAAIVRATIAEVGEKGWAGATVEGIAARAGVGRGSIYRRWPSKSDLFQYTATALMRPAESVDTGSFVDDLFAAVLPMADMLTQPDLAALLPSLLAEATKDASIKEALRAFALGSRQQAIDAVERARGRGDIPRSTDADALVDLIAGGLVYRSLLLGEATDAAAVRTLIRQAVQSVSPRAMIKEGS